MKTIYNGTYSVYIHYFPNGKVYIGITRRAVERRWNNGKGYEEQPLMDRAIKKYGWSNIEHEVFASNLTKEEALHMEALLIDAFNSTNRSYGYNIVTYGTASNWSLQEAKEIYSLWENGYGIKKIAEKFERSTGTISNIIKLFGVTEEEIEKRRREQIAVFSTKYKKEDVLKLWKEGKKRNEIEKILNCSHTYVTDTLNFFGIPLEERRARSHGRPVEQYTLKGEYIKTWNTAQEANKALRGNGKGGHIVDVCKGRRKSALGYIWKYSD